MHASADRITSISATLQTVPCWKIWIICIALLHSGGMFGQSAASTDFRKVPDVLNGQRTLLRVDDLQVVEKSQNGDLSTSAILQTTNGTIAVQGAVQNDLLSNGPTIRAHMFSQPGDTEIGMNRFGMLGISDYTHGRSVPVSSAPGQFGDRILLTAGDFDGDGLDEVAAFDLSAGQLLICKPKPGTTISSGDFYQPASVRVGVIDSDPQKTVLVSGDFNGDGKQELVLASTSRIVVFSVNADHTASAVNGINSSPYPAPKSNGSPSTLRLSGIPFLAALLLLGFFTKRQQVAGLCCSALIVITSLNLSGCGGRNSSNPVSPPTGVGADTVSYRLAAASGHFAGTSADSLVIARAPIDGTGSAVLYGVDFDSQLNINVHSANETGVSGPFNGNIGVAKARLDGSGNDVLILKQAPSSDNQRRIQAVSFDSNFAPTFHPNVDLNSANTCQSDSVAVGNFSQTIAAAGGLPTDQVGILSYACQPPYNQQVTIYTVDPSTYTFKQSQVFQLTGFTAPPDFQAFSLLSTDTQSRSLILGSPTVYTLADHTQPVVSLAMPPMHIDCDDEVAQSLPPGVDPCTIPLNVSGLPSTFNSSYSQDASSGVSVQSKDSTSWNNGVGLTVGAKFVVGPKTDNISFSDQAAVSGTWGGSVEHNYGTTSAFSQSFSSTTRTSDEVVYTSSAVTFYIYPVIGRFSCPQGHSTCDDKDKQQDVVTFSGRSSSQLTAAAANGLPWYQPPWEPFNVLSYPGNQTQLKVWNPNLNILTGNPTAYVTDENPITESTKWSDSANSSTATSSTQQYSVSNTFSVAYNSVNPAFGGGGANASFSFEHSNSFAGLNTNGATVNNTVGVFTNKPGIPQSAVNSYSVVPLLAGEQKSPVASADGLNPSSQNQIFGVLQSLNTVVLNPGSGTTGSLWSGPMYNTAPDLAFTHPYRWTLSTVALATPLPRNCLPVTGSGTLQMNCATKTKTVNGDPRLDNAHAMRGFFISSTPDDPSEKPGSQLQTGREGQNLDFGVRVSNYSLMAVPSQATIHVRLYARDETDAATPDVFIGEGTASTLPGFSSAADTPPNWTTITIANKNLDKYVNHNLVFWTIVWAEQNGSLLSERKGHGLTQMPGGNTDLTYAEALTMDEYGGNNLGVYNTLFRMLAKDAPSDEPTLNGTEQSSLAAALSVDSPLSAAAGTSSVLSLTITPPASIPFVRVLFYEGSPVAGSSAFAEERLPLTGKGVTDLLRKTYSRTSCGEQTIVAVIAPGRSYSKTVETTLPSTCGSTPQL